MFNVGRTFKNAVKSKTRMLPIPPEVQDLLKGLSYVSKALLPKQYRLEEIQSEGKEEWSKEERYPLKVPVQPSNHTMPCSSGADDALQAFSQQRTSLL